MSLPTNYRQVAMMGPTPTPGPTHVYMPASPLMSNILKERLARTTTTTTASSSKGVGEANVPSPFSTPVHGNPAFNPQKMGTGKGAVSKQQAAEGRIPKPPKAPDKPLMPYMRYSRKVWDQVKAANTELKLWEIGKIIGSMWRDLPEADKQDFVDEYESEKLEYEKALKTYHASPSYQAYLSAKTRGAVASEEKEVVDRTAVTTTKLDRRIDIQPAEDDDGQYYDDGLSLKQVSHTRFSRNHRLINEIFSEIVVPDVRSVVTSQRLSVLRRQVQSLTMHQKKLETELQQIEEKFEDKKRKFVEAGDGFQLELKKVKALAPKLDEGSFAVMVERQKEVVRREAEERQRTAQGLPPRPPSTSSSQATAGAATTAPANREESSEAAGPAPQNTATLVDALPPAPIQEGSESGGDGESKGEASTGVTSAAATTAPSIAVAGTTTPAVPAVNGPTSAASSTVSGTPVHSTSRPTPPPEAGNSTATYPQQPSPSLTYPQQPSPSLTYPQQSSPSLTYPQQPSPSLTYPQQPSPSLTYPQQPSPSLTHPQQPSPSLTYPQQPSPSLTYPQQPSPSLTHPQQPSPSLTHPQQPSPSLTHPQQPSPSLTHPQQPSLSLTYPQQPSPSLTHPQQPSPSLTHPQQPSPSLTPHSPQMNPVHRSLTPSQLSVDHVVPSNIVPLAHPTSVAPGLSGVPSTAFSGNIAPQHPAASSTMIPVLGGTTQLAPNPVLPPSSMVLPQASQPQSPHTAFAFQPSGPPS